MLLIGVGYERDSHVTFRTEGIAVDEKYQKGLLSILRYTLTAHPYWSFLIAPH